ncbi:hypothetical protein [Micromonospora sp. WMMD1082]|uniref:hypothetical protein n=1 Tax=Micromonospora sp. WMMD1082 TaxID=3016104 RepID=UPI002415EF07|nr:hypothetical protein [Micromonospora sp. WMMD1082]MDG4793307.1 hypothetical protein [Micromonospora sp. WMMD1082]
MNIRRWSVGVIAATLLVPGVTACNSGGDSPSATAPSAESGIPADPKAALVASTKGLAEGNFTFTITADSMSGKGTFHKPSNSAQMTMTVGGEDFTMDFDLIQIQPDTWVKVDLGDLFAGIPGMEAFKDKYQHLDATKAKEAKNLDVFKEGSDPAAASEMFEGLAEVQQTGEGAYSGTFDLSAVKDSVAADEDLLKELGDQAKAIPFTAKLDAEGRLTELVMSIPAAGEAEAQEIKITYADYGAATGVQKPPADQVIEASEQTYEMFK